MRDMQQRIVRAAEVARSTVNVRTADWLSRVLGFEVDDVAVPMDELTAVTAASYLDRSKPISALLSVDASIHLFYAAGNYTMTIEGRGCRGKILRFCVISDIEQRKCQDLRMAALSRRVLPEITCIRGSSTVDCMDRIRRNEADLRNFDSNDAYRGGRFERHLSTKSTIQVEMAYFTGRTA